MTWRTVPGPRSQRVLNASRSASLSPALISSTDPPRPGFSTPLRLVTDILLQLVTDVKPRPEIPPGAAGFGSAAVSRKPSERHAAVVPRRADHESPRDGSARRRASASTKKFGDT